MNNPLPDRLARQYSTELMKEMDHHHCLDFETTRTVSTAPLFRPGGGQMFGVLVCEDPEGHEVILKAFSGQYEGTWMIPGWVPPVCDVREFSAVISHNDREIHRLTDPIMTADEKTASALIERRKALSQESLKRVYGLYAFRCIDGSTITLQDVFGGRLPPTGTGDCCGPKLLNHAFKEGLQPKSMAEFYFGASNSAGTREHGAFYGPCDDRCRPLLKQMLMLDIIYCDETLIVVNKPSGLLSVPGREVFDCAEARVKRLFPDTIKQPAVHRLDMDTSGLIVYALTREAHRDLSIQFMNRQVKKTYTALLEGIITEESGRIELPFRLDVDNRPYQIYDPLQGKLGITEWRRVSVEYFKPGRPATRIEFTPLTGRTHQLRVHSAHDLGLGHPIIGDKLYGREEPGQRLLLHADMLSFLHPESGERLTFELPPEF